MTASANTPTGDSQQLDVVDFRLFERRADGGAYEGIYGISVAKVREILVLPEVSRVPGAHPAIEGIFNLRGVQVPAVNLSRWLELEEAPPEGTSRKVIVCELGDQSLGLIVHQASRIRSVPWSSVQPAPPLIANRHGAVINGTTRIDDEHTLLLVDVEQIVAEVMEELGGGPGDPASATASPAVLTVDDSPVARTQVRQALVQAGHRVLEAANGREALDLLQREAEGAAQAGESLAARIIAVVTDVEMPLMNGYDLVRAVRADPRLSQVPLVMHSSLAGGDHAKAGREAGCDEYLVKFDAHALVATVRRLTG